MRDIYIGGADDDDSGVVRRYANEQRRQHPQRDVRYYEWWDLRGIANAINTTPREAPLNVIGHSMGGAEAIRQAAATRRRIDRLITIDPVNARDPLRPSFTRDHVGAWANVTSASDDWRNPGNIIARAGGRVSSRVTDMADLRHRSRANHGEFARMMAEINAARGIDSTYRPRRFPRTSR